MLSFIYILIFLYLIVRRDINILAIIIIGLFLGWFLPISPLLMALISLLFVLTSVVYYFPPVTNFTINLLQPFVESKNQSLEHAVELFTEQKQTGNDLESSNFKESDLHLFEKIFDKQFGSSSVKNPVKLFLKKIHQKGWLSLNLPMMQLLAQKNPEYLLTVYDAQFCHKIIDKHLQNSVKKETVSSSKYQKFMAFDRLIDPLFFLSSPENSFANASGTITQHKNNRKVSYWIEATIFVDDTIKKGQKNLPDYYCIPIHIHDPNNQLPKTHPLSGKNYLGEWLVLLEASELQSLTTSENKYQNISISLPVDYVLGGFTTPLPASEIIQQYNNHFVAVLGAFLKASHYQLIFCLVLLQQYVDRLNHNQTQLKLWHKQLHQTAQLLADIKENKLSSSLLLNCCYHQLKKIHSEINQKLNSYQLNPVLQKCSKNLHFFKQYSNHCSQYYHLESDKTSYDEEKLSIEIIFKSAYLSLSSFIYQLFLGYLTPIAEKNVTLIRRQVESFAISLSLLNQLQIYRPFVMINEKSNYLELYALLHDLSNRDNINDSYNTVFYLNKIQHKFDLITNQFKLNKYALWLIRRIFLPFGVVHYKTADHQFYNDLEWSEKEKQILQQIEQQQELLTQLESLAVKYDKSKTYEQWMADLYTKKTISESQYKQWLITYQNIKNYQ